MTTLAPTLKALIADFDLTTATGRAGALRKAIPAVARIEDPDLRDEYARELAGWIGWVDSAQVVRWVRAEAAGAREWDPALTQASAPSDTNRWLEREVIKSALQNPLVSEAFDTLTADMFSDPDFRALWQAVGDASTRRVLAELLAEPRATSPADDAALLVRMRAAYLGRQIAELQSQLRRMDLDDPTYNAGFGELAALANERRQLVRGSTAIGQDLRRVPRGGHRRRTHAAIRNHRDAPPVVTSTVATTVAAYAP